MRWTRRIFLKIGLGIFLVGWKLLSICWAKAKQILPRGFSRNQLKEMNPVEIDGRNLGIDPLNQFGTMGPTVVQIDLKTYRLKVTGEMERPLSLTYDQILKYPSLTETVLLICSGFFANNEISEKVPKSLITPIRDRLHRQETYRKIMEICIIIF